MRTSQRPRRSRARARNERWNGSQLLPRSRVRNPAGWNKPVGMRTGPGGVASLSLAAYPQVNGMVSVEKRGRGGVDARSSQPRCARRGVCRHQSQCCSSTSMNMGLCPVSVDFSAVKIWSSLEGSHHAKAFPVEFRNDVVAVACKGEAPLTQIARDFGIAEACLHRWLKLADVEDGVVTRSPRTKRRRSVRSVNATVYSSCTGRRDDDGFVFTRPAAEPIRPDFFSQSRERLIRSFTHTEQVECDEPSTLAFERPPTLLAFGAEATGGRMR